MKIAIITFQDAINYGAAMQAFALKQVMGEYGKCDIINYYNEFFHKYKEKKSVKDFVSLMLNTWTHEKKRGKFEKFQSNYLTDFTKQYTDDELGELNSKYDLFITGSYQVWNLECSGNKTAYFLDFVEDNNKKASYAASFGGTYLTNELLIKNMLSSFSNISIREESGKQFLKKLLGRDCPVVLDPTLLLDKEEWKNYFQLGLNEEYVLVYEVLNGSKLLSLAKQYAMEYHLTLKYITSSNRPQLGIQCIRDASPEEWLQLIANSAYVFTNSFHGLAFSLIFEKQFAVELLPPPATTNGRLIELLQQLGLEERVISDCLPPHGINYNSVNMKLKTMREKSLAYICKMVGVSMKSES